MHYNYLEAMVEDITDWMKCDNFDLSEYSDLEEAHEYLHDELWDDDSITGNGGKWYASIEKCELYLCGNWILIFEAINDFCTDMNDALKKYGKNLPQFLDCLVRLNLLDEAIEKVLGDLQWP